MTIDPLGCSQGESKTFQCYKYPQNEELESRNFQSTCSTNPREYVQRIGRIIRQAQGKYSATIHDLIIEPALNAFYDEELTKLEVRIFKKEMDRVLDLSRNAINNTTVVNVVYNKLEEVAL